MEPERQSATAEFGSAGSILKEAMAEQAREREAWEAALYECSDAVLWCRIDAEEDVRQRGKITRVNPAAENLLGPGLLVAGHRRPILDIVPPEYVDRHLKGIGADLEKPREVSYLGQWHHDFEAVKTDDSVIPISLLVLKLRNGNSRRYLAMMRRRDD